MSEEKTEQPTSQKLDESRKKGQVAQRKNVSEAFTLLVGSLFLFSTTNMFINGIIGVLDLALRDLDQSLFDRRGDILSRFVGGVKYGFILTAILAVLGLAFHLTINKFNFAPKSLSPKFEKFNPINGLKGIFSKNTAYTFIRLIVYFCSAVVIFYAIVWGNFSEILKASACGISCIADVFIYLFSVTIALLLLVLIILAAFDFKIQNAIFVSQSKMTKDEVKRQHKGNEGDPLIKGTRKQIAMQDANLPSLRELTHAVYSGGFLVGLIYYKGNLPFVVVRSKGDGVARQVAKMRSAGVTCVNLPEVARAFYQAGVVGQYLPKKHMKGMAKILG